MQERGIPDTSLKIQVHSQVGESEDAAFEFAQGA
jgi:hypothetical protein